MVQRGLARHVGVNPVPIVSKGSTLPQPEGAQRDVGAALLATLLRSWFRRAGFADHPKKAHHEPASAALPGPRQQSGWEGTMRAAWAARVALVLSLAAAAAACAGTAPGNQGFGADDAGEGTLGGLFQDGGSKPGSDAKGNGAADGGTSDGAVSDVLADSLVDTAAQADAGLGDGGAKDSADAKSDVKPKDVQPMDVEGGCTQSDQCPAEGACKVGECQGNVCVLTPIWGCCEAGACCDPDTHQPKTASSACDAAALQTEYDCQGQDVVVRTLQPGCDGSTADSCAAEVAAAVWTPWKVVTTCAAGSSCLLLSKTKKPMCNSGPPPECVEDAGCDDGNPCTQNACVGLKCQPAVPLLGAVCSAVPGGAQYQCSGTGLGSDVQVKKGYNTCNAVGQCTAQTLVWDVWMPYKSCNYNEVCKVTDPTKPGICEKGPDCTPSSTCCTADGKFAAKATPCGTFVWDTEYQCVGGSGATFTGGSIQMRESVSGCSGTSTFCSTVNKSWSPWTTVATCKATQDCKPSYSKSIKPSCDYPCTPNSTCCQADGSFAAHAVKCGSSSMDSEQKCSGPEKGAKILERKAYCGCKGTAASCSCSTADYAWSDWLTYKTCLASEVCELSFGYASCVSAYKCTPNATCCDADGQFKPKTEACGSSTADTEYMCSGTGKGAKVQKRIAHYGCSGTSTSCSYSASNYVWDPWTTVKTCSATQYCKMSASYIEPTCSATP